MNHIPSRSNGDSTRWTLEEAYEALIESIAQLPVAGTGSLGFSWRGQWFALRTHSRESESVVEISACLGHMPFTAENRDLRVSLMERFAAEPAGVRATLGTDDRNRLWLISLIGLDRRPSLADLSAIGTTAALVYDRLLADVLPFLRPAAA